MCEMLCKNQVLESATTIKPLTSDVTNNIDYLVTMAPVKQKGILDKKGLLLNYSKPNSLVECCWYAVGSTYLKWFKERTTGVTGEQGSLMPVEWMSDSVVWSNRRETLK